ncbi:MAG: PocR ligand-binding domain-containing protein [Clostridia bacterium]|nr:PocR ligand-binding domain-containing protein [Clostridia bacterium]
MDKAIDLKEIIRACEFDRLQRHTAAATKVAIITVDYTGAPVTEHSGCSEFCKAVRSNPSLAGLCEMCDSRGGLEAARRKSPYIYRCHMNLIDFAVPVVYDGIYLGAIMCGQICPQGSDWQLESVVDSRSDIDSIEGGRQMYSQLATVSRAELESIVDMISYICNYRIASALDGKIVTPNIRIDRNLLAVEPAIRFIEQNYSSQIRQEDMAALCKVSAGYFSKLFVKATGKSFSAYVNYVRISHAKRLLNSCAKSVSAVAYECGFCDPGYFIKVFSRLEGMTPEKYRNSVTCRMRLSADISN